MAAKISDVIIAKSKEISQLKTEIEQLAKLQERFPDLERHKDRWDNYRLVSKEVNAVADQCTFKHSCGCCPDSPLYAWPYIVIDGVEIYSNPPNITIGEKNPWPEVGKVYKSEVAYAEWENNLRNHNISEVVIEKVRGYLSAVADLDEPHEPLPDPFEDEF